MVTSSKDGFIVGADITEFTDLFAGPEEELIANNLKANRYSVPSRTCRSPR